MEQQLEQQPKHVNVIICTPGHSLTAPYVKSIFPMLNELNNRGISWAFSNEYSSHVADAREITLSGSFQNSYNEQRPFNGTVTYDKLMWIDSDIAWKPEDFIKLYESDKDIITGAYLLATGEATVYPKMLSPGYSYEQILVMTELTQIECAGFGFLCVKQGVFESLSRPWFQSVWYTTKDPETGREVTFPLMGEDISWCQRVRNAGYEIWFDPTVRVTHHKTMKLTWEGIRP